MKKVVINNCCGGFGISNKALLWLIKKDSVLVSKTTFIKYYGYHSNVDIKKELASSVEECRDDNSFFKHKFHDGWLYKDGYVFGLNDDDIREHADLIAVVEDLDELAFGDSAILKVVKVPDDVKYEIVNTAGVEVIHEEHRTWN